MEISALAVSPSGSLIATGISPEFTIFPRSPAIK